MLYAEVTKPKPCRSQVFETRQKSIKEFNYDGAKARI